MLYTTRSTVLIATFFGVAACETPAPTTAPPAPPAAELSAPDFLIDRARVGGPLPGLSGVQRRRFEMGRAVFQTVFTPETGLGPLFNAVSCASCHEQPVVGGGGSNADEGGEDIEVHATAFHAGSGTAQCDDLAAVGGQVIQKQLTPAFSDYMHLTAEPIPAAATDSGHRTTPDLFGFGLLDAVPDREILARADPMDRNGDGISTRSSWRWVSRTPAIRRSRRSPVSRSPPGSIHCPSRRSARRSSPPSMHSSAFSRHRHARRSVSLLHGARCCSGRSGARHVTSRRF
ncbi:MAG: hypothetical protein AUH41_11550 [Gemmatimonadetes bacterium 13_1_40CM_66_11]|nr:MAG: hypothetical protein AUH41_11550 [Gemmatimonadetes bacterium 13_1_40CM_66_11]